MNDEQKVATTSIVGAASIVLLIGIMVGRGCNRPASPMERLLAESFEHGRQRGFQDCMKLISDLGMEGKTASTGFPISSNRWLNIRYEVVTSGLTSQEASNLWFAYRFAKTNNFSIEITNLSGPISTNQMPGAKEDKP